MLTREQALVFAGLIVIVFLALFAWILIEKIRISRIQARRKQIRLEKERITHELQVETVKRTSRKYRAMLQLNQKYQFNEHVRAYYERWTTVNSKAQLDRFDFEAFFLNGVEEQLQVYGNVVAAIEENRKKYALYRYELDSIPTGRITETDALVEMSDRIYEDIESYLCSNLFLEPVVGTSVKCTVSYSSPRGRNSYDRYQVFSYDQIRNALIEVERKAKDKESAQYQRRIMTDSLRYDVMKRDGFRCVICGQTAKDGVKLHVDHIRPVSKGGKTELSNLRTLCSTCNMGKRDKYDAYGCN